MVRAPLAFYRTPATQSRRGADTCGSSSFWLHRTGSTRNGPPVRLEVPKWQASGPWEGVRGQRWEEYEEDAPNDQKQKTTRHTVPLTGCQPPAACLLSSLNRHICQKRPTTWRGDNSAPGRPFGLKTNGFGAEWTGESTDGLGLWPQSAGCAPAANFGKLRPSSRLRFRRL